MSILNLSCVSAWTAAASQGISWEEDQKIGKVCIPGKGAVCPPVPPPPVCLGGPGGRGCPKKKAYFIELVSRETVPSYGTGCVELMNQPPDILELKGGRHADDDGANGGFKDGDLLVWFQNGEEVLRSPLTVVSSKKAVRRIAGSDIPRAGRYLIGVVHGKNPGKYMWSRSATLKVADRGGCREKPIVIQGGAGKK